MTPRRYASLAEVEADPALTREALAEVLEFASELGDELEREQAAVAAIRAARPTSTTRQARGGSPADGPSRGPGGVRDDG